MLGIDVRGLVEAAGYVGITAIVFCESGVLLGFFLPGDSLLFTAGFLAGRGVLDLRLLVALCFLAAAAGDSVGYAMGKRYGRRLFSRRESRFFRRDHLVRAEAFFEHHGGRAVVLARFLPWVRTFTPIAAGIGSMHYRRFLAVNLLGAALWAVGLPVAGSLLGSTVPNADRYLLPAILVVIAVSAAISSRQFLRQATRPAPAGQPVAAPPVAHRLDVDPFGHCNYVSLDEVSGYGVAGTRCRDALGAAGVDVTWTPMQPVTGAAALAYRPATLPPGPFDTVVTHTVPEYFGAIRNRWSTSLHVGHTVWETDRLPTHWPALLEVPDLLVVPCRWNADTIASADVRVPVAVVPHVAPAVRRIESETWADIDDETYVFYSVGQWTERKAVDLTVRAYLEAFTRNDRVLLVVKTSWRDCTYSGPAPRGHAGPGTTAGALAPLLARWGGQDPPPVRLVTRDLNDDEMAALHTRGDCYVSLCRSEGWGLGAFDAAAYGNPVVITGFGGQLDYLDPAASWLVDHDLVPVEAPSLGPSYTPDQRWAEPSVAHGVARLREVFEAGAEARARAAPLVGSIADRCSPAAVAATFAAALACAR